MEPAPADQQGICASLFLRTPRPARASDSVCPRDGHARVHLESGSIRPRPKAQAGRPLGRAKERSMSHDKQRGRRRAGAGTATGVERPMERAVAAGDRAIIIDVMRERLGINVRARRSAASLSVKQASARVQMSPNHWRKIENGEVDVTLQTLARLGEALEVDPA